MFGRKALNQRIKVLEKSLDAAEKYAKAENDQIYKALKQLFLINHKPKYKSGQKVWIRVYEWGCFTTKEAVIVCGYADKMYDGTIGYVYKCVVGSTKEHIVSECSVYTTEPKSCK